MKLSSIVRLLPVLRVRRVGPEHAQPDRSRGDEDAKAPGRREDDAENDAGAGRKEGEHVDTRA